MAGQEDLEMKLPALIQKINSFGAPPFQSNPKPQVRPVIQTPFKFNERTVAVYIGVWFRSILNCGMWKNRDCYGFPNDNRDNGS
jgi:hypothetical protein